MANRHPGLRALCAIILVSMPVYAVAQRSIGSNRCEALEKLVYPATDMPSPRDLRALSGCDAAALYYGLGGAPEYRQAMFCAHAAADHSFHSEGILAMLYANGQGGERDYQYARKAACSAGANEVEVADLLSTIDGAERDGTPIDICVNPKGDTIAGGCALVAAKRQGVILSGKLAKLTAGWSAAEFAALELLHTAQTRFSDMRAEAEIPTGAKQEARTIAERAQLDSELIFLVEQFEAKAQIPYTPGAQRVLEQTLSMLNSQVLAAAKAAPTGGVTPESLQRASKAWLTYRDAWEKFALTRYPKVSKATVACAFMSSRVRMMKLTLQELQTSGKTLRVKGP